MDIVCERVCGFRGGDRCKLPTQGERLKLAAEYLGGGAMEAMAIGGNMFSGSGAYPSTGGYGFMDGARRHAEEIKQRVGGCANQVLEETVQFLPEEPKA